MIPFTPHVSQLATPRAGRTSALYRKLGRKTPGHSLAAARALAPPEPRGARAEYTRKLHALWERWTPIAMREAGARYDAELFTASFDQLVAQSGLKEFLEQLGRKQNGQVGRYMATIVRTPARPTGLEIMLDEFTDRNIELIKGLGQDQADRLRELLRSARQVGMRHEELAPMVQQTLDVGESRAALIARDQTLKFNGALQQAHQVSNGITEFVWLTTGDGSVRDSHRELNGRTFSWSNPPIVDGQRATPGQPIQCRCQAVPKVSLFEGI